MIPIPWDEKPLLLFAMLYPVLGIVMARRRLASGRGSIVTLATLPLTAGVVTFWLGLPAAEGPDTPGEPRHGEDRLRIDGHPRLGLAVQISFRVAID